MAAASRASIIADSRNTLKVQFSPRGLHRFRQRLLRLACELLLHDLLDGFLDVPPRLFLHRRFQHIEHGNWISILSEPLPDERRPRGGGIDECTGLAQDLAGPRSARESGEFSMRDRNPRGRQRSLLAALLLEAHEPGVAIAAFGLASAFLAGSIRTLRSM
jgi:hypothetical protein